MESLYLGLGAALLSAFSWALGSVVYEKLGLSVPPLPLNLCKNLLGLVLFGAFVLILAGGDPAGLVANLSATDLLLLTVSGLLGITLGDTFFFMALNDLGAHALVVLSLLGQVLTVLFAIAFLGERPTPGAISGMVLITLGIAVVLFAKIGDSSHKSSVKGLWLGLLAVLCMSAGTIVTKLGISTVSAENATFIRMLSGTLGLVAFALAGGRLGTWLRPLAKRSTLGGIGVAVIIASFGGFWLSHVALKHLDVAIAVTLNSTEPLFVIPIAALLMAERVRLVPVIGSLLAFAGIAVLVFSASQVG
jgi:drug/metabolite transporter (DMT)-like permease